MPASAALPGRPRAAGRLTRSPELAAALAARLTARDRWLLRMLHEHRVLTTTQIAELAFGTTRAATARMATLYQYRAVDRFRPLAPAGSAPLHFILDDAGAAVLAAEDGTTTAELGYRRDRAVAIALSPRLGHTTGANGFFTALAAAARASTGQHTLECWWSERRCAAIWGDLARPDGYGRWREQPPGHLPATADFFLEYDTGSEDLPRLIAKLAGYAALAARTGIATPVLFWLPTARREAALRARLAGPPPHGIRDAASAAQIPGVPVATAAPGTGHGGPAGAAWLRAGAAWPRLRLAQLAAPGTPAPAPGPQPGGQPAAPPGGLAWYPPDPAPPAWHALPGTARTRQASDD
jgi:Replication-relaxation